MDRVNTPYKYFKLSITLFGILVVYIGTLKSIFISYNLNWLNETIITAIGLSMAVLSTKGVHYALFGAKEKESNPSKKFWGLYGNMIIVLLYAIMIVLIIKAIIEHI